MSKKAVYSNKGLQVYITAEDFEELLETGQIYLDVRIGSSAAPVGMAFVHMAPPTIDHLKRALKLEQAAIDEAKDAAQKRRYISGRPLPKSKE